MRAGSLSMATSKSPLWPTKVPPPGWLENRASHRGRELAHAGGQGQRGWASAVVPQEPKVFEVLPLMYLHGMSSGDFVPALEEFFGSAAGLSASVVTPLTKQWQDEAWGLGPAELSQWDPRFLRGCIQVISRIFDPISHSGQFISPRKHGNGPFSPVPVVV